MIDPQPATSTLFPGHARGCGGYGCGNRRRCRGPIHLLVAYLVQKHHEKKEERMGHVDAEDSVVQGGQMERGVVEVDEKEDKDDVEGEKVGDLKILEESVRSMSM
ncbi:hypothetical protein MMC28_002952 [Mycoblastus sanguinarius]|nr:hypothetical protein [Mycoblastus sanguinarius]